MFFFFFFCERKKKEKRKATRLSAGLHSLCGIPQSVKSCDFLPIGQENTMGLTLVQSFFSSLFFLCHFFFLYARKNKRFSWGTAQSRELQASPDLLRRDRLKLRLRNHFPGLYETSIICIPCIRCRTREISRTKWPGGESLEPARDGGVR